MSLDQARAFIEKMKSDVAFSESIIAIENIAERFNFIKYAGFDCCETEIQEVAGELSDEDLDAAAGGLITCYIVGYHMYC
jgi:predicted ribosomally synthesized peptide with nif11-like leader